MHLGARLGRYEILSVIGAGGMGEVFRARDARLGRDVAIKVLPAFLSRDPAALARFEREARAIGALNHPNIVNVFDVGSESGESYVVMELIEGETLRARLGAGQLPPRKAADIAAQIARALGAAHDKGIVHRDIKPENVFLTTEGRVKVLDFGLARQVSPLEEISAGATLTHVQTSDGVVLGTIGYMSPEQVRGVTADHRADIFALGVVLYEMLTGRRPFGGDSAVETMNAILKEDPPSLNISDAALAPVVEHCLEKDPAERFQSARDLAFDLDAVRTRSDSGRTPAVAGASPHARMRIIPIAATVAALALGVAFERFVWRGAAAAPDAPTFTRLTYEKGTIWNARFAPDGQSLVYGAAWDGGPIHLLLSRADRTGSTSLNLPDAALLSIASTGELAISLGHAFQGWMGEGTLARVPLLGGSPRPVAEHVREADWTPAGSGLAVVRRLAGTERLEFPIGKALFQTSGYISHIRFSRDGHRIAFVDHPLYADDSGDIAVVDLDGKQTTLARGFLGLRGIAWSADGSEIWFTAGADVPKAGGTLRAVTLEGRARTVQAMPTDWRILDIAADGRLLFETELTLRNIDVIGETKRHDFSLFDQSVGSAISDDGKMVLITDQGSVAGTVYATYLRRTDEGGAVRLGEGQALGFSPDMQSVLSVVYGPPSRLLLLPIGTGEMKELPNPEKLTISVAAVLPDGKRVALLGSNGSGPPRGYVQDIETGAMRAFTDPGVTTSTVERLPVTPDGARALFVDPSGATRFFPIAGGPSELARGIAPGEYAVGWAPGGREMYVASAAGVPNRVYRVEIATGRRTLWKELYPAQVAGVRLSVVNVTPDGKTILHTYSRLLSDLYVMDSPSAPARK